MTDNTEVSNSNTCKSSIDNIGTGNNKFDWKKVKTEVAFNKRKLIKEKVPEPKLLQGRNLYSTLTEESNSHYKNKTKSDIESNKTPGYVNNNKIEKNKVENERKVLTDKLHQKKHITQPDK